MALRPTRFSRVSIGFVDSVRSIVDADAGDTGAAFSVTGAQVFTGQTTLGSPSIVGNTSEAPASSTSAGTAGQIYFSQSHMYLCTSDNSWSRVTLYALP
jgi:hypothetical protein